MSELISGKEALIYGVGVNDFDGNISINGKHIPEYSLWKAMLRRCYSEKFKHTRNTYNNCIISAEFMSFKNFHDIVKDTYGFGLIDKNGKKYHLDKDLLGEGYLYSKDTICFVPSEINAFLTNDKSANNGYPVGVSYHKASGKIISQITKNGKRKYLGLFNEVESAFEAYKDAKEAHSKFLAEKYRLSISETVYHALMSYAVEEYF